MKNKVVLLSILPFFFASILTSCDDDDKDSLRLSKNSVTIGTRGGEESIQLTADGEWEIKDIPEWISVNPTAGDHSAELTITAIENKEDTRRKASLVFIRGNASKTLEIEQYSLMDLDSFIELSESALAMGTISEIRTIKITSNSSWEVTNVPDWILVSPMSGDKSAEIRINVKENREPKGRDANLKFVSKDISETLSVRQFGLQDVLWPPTLPIFSFKQINFDGALSDYTMLARSLFVNPSIKDKIYLGNLLSHNAQSNTNIPEFTGYTFNPITASVASVSSVTSKTFLPSRLEHDAYAKEVILSRPSQSESFIADNGSIEFYNYRRLYTLGIANMGVKLDEIVSGSSFTEKKMEKKYGLIFSFKHIQFSLDMDIPENLITEEITEADKTKGVSYVSSVSYGKVGILIVESDTDSRVVKIAINKVIANQSLSQEESDIIQSADISCVYFNNNSEVQVKKGNLDAIDKYKAVIKDADNIYPVAFQLSNYVDHSASSISFSFKVPK